MKRFADPLSSWISRLWRTDAPLTATGLAIAGLLPFFVAGLWLDPRTIGGAPAWLKPAKFAASIAMYTLTMAWMYTWLADWPRVRRAASLVSVGALVIEMAIIALQAARGTTSHFNVQTALDGILFGIMGAAILLQTCTSLAVLVALWKQTFRNAAMGWALRLGLLITILGAFSGGLMTQPTAAQLAEARSTGRMPVAGAHTVGAPDGGPGLPGTGWSRTHGDLRVAHFVGLHAMQVLPILTLLLGTVRRRDVPVRSVLVIASSHAGLFALLLWQALRGDSLVAPDALTVAAVSVWGALTAVGLWWSLGGAVATINPSSMRLRHDA
jgi:hypothetical protein